MPTSGSWPVCGSTRTSGARYSTPGSDAGPRGGAAPTRGPVRARSGAGGTVPARGRNSVLMDLTAALAQVGMTVALCDAQARMVQRLGGDRHLRERLDAVSFAPGFDASEQTAGTNGVGTALAERSPCYVVGREHFADCLQPFACAGAPVRDPLSGRIEAVLDITCLRDNGDPGMVRLVREAARDIERGCWSRQRQGAGAARRVPAGIPRHGRRGRLARAARARALGARDLRARNWPRRWRPPPGRPGRAAGEGRGTHRLAEPHTRRGASVRGADRHPAAS